MLAFLVELVSCLFQLCGLWVLLKICLGFYRNCSRPGYNLRKRYS